jgi:hypothetical protein
MAPRLKCLAMILCGALLGCETTAQRVGRDPILLSKHGVEGNPANVAPSALLVSAEPLPPDLPAIALVSARQPAALLREQAGALARQKLETNANRLPGAVEKDVANQPPAPAPVLHRDRLPMTAVPVKRHVVHGIYGAATDHSWLQGTVESLGPDGAVLRYGHPWVAGAEAFRVLLLPDDRLKELRNGDVIRVEGEESENPANRSLPHYQMKTMNKVSLDS